MSKINSQLNIPLTKTFLFRSECWSHILIAEEIKLENVVSNNDDGGVEFCTC